MVEKKCHLLKNSLHRKSYETIEHEHIIQCTIYFVLKQLFANLNKNQFHSSIFGKIAKIDINFFLFLKIALNLFGM